MAEHGDDHVAAREAVPPDGFLERLAHDLRGPLSPLQTAAYLLRREDLDAERQRDLLDIIERQTARLSGMVQEVSDWMRARQSRLVGHREPIAVPMLLELVAARVPGIEPALVDAGLDDAMVDGDAQRLVQMLATVLEYQQSRSVSVRLSARGQDGEVSITVAVPAPWEEGEAEALLGSAEAAPFDEGLGMRLLIAQAIARAHGGELGAMSSTRESVVEVRLPLYRQPG